MDRSELEKSLLELTGKMAERAILSLVECATRMLAGDQSGAARRAEEGARRQKLQTAHDVAAQRIKTQERLVQEKLERKKAATEAAKPKAEPKKGDVTVVSEKPAKPKEQGDAKNPAG